MFYVLTIKDKEYKCVLSASACVEAERRLGKNPLEVFMDGMPKMEDMLIILHASLLKYNHSITLNEAYDIYDSFMEDGHGIKDFIDVIMGIFKESGFIKPEEEKDEGKSGKN